MTPEYSDEHRREIIRGLEQEQQARDAKRAELEQAKAKIDAEDRASADAMLRAQSPSFSRDICPSCWIKHGVESKLEAVQHEDPANFDLWHCKACDYFEERPA